MTAEALVTQVIKAAIDRGNTSADNAKEFARAAQSAAAGQLFPGDISPIRDIEVNLTKFNPDQDLTGLFEKTLNDALAQFGPGFDNHLRTFLEKYFPAFDHCLMNTVDPWICQTIRSGGIGLPLEVEQALYERARGRELQQAQVQTSQAVEEFASRGFDLPAGVLVDSVARIQQDASDKAASHARDIAVEQAKFRLDMLKFAVDQGVRMRLSVLQAVIDYIRAYLTTIELAIKEAEAMVAAKNNLWQTTSAYYHALVAVGSLMLRHDEIVANLELRKGTVEAEAFTERARTMTEAAISAAKAMGDIAAAAYGAQNTIADISHQALESL